MTIYCLVFFDEELVLYSLMYNGFTEVMASNVFVKLYL